MTKKISLGLLLFVLCLPLVAQDSQISLDRIFSGEFRQEYGRSIQWIEEGDAYVTIEDNKTLKGGGDELIRYESASLESSVFVPASALKTDEGHLSIESFSLSPDGSKVLIFTNSSRVWRSNTKGDYWVYDRDNSQLTQLGRKMDPSSLMFAKFSSDNSFVAYVHKFNVYMEDFTTGKVTQLTEDGDGDLINGTFDWVYEEEFGKRDGFAISPENGKIAFWHLDASDTGVFYMINNTDSIYSKPIPIQYPKVGEAPSAAKLGLIDLRTNKTQWIPLPGGERENYIPVMQWIEEDLLLIQQMNRHQNQLKVWTFRPSNQTLTNIYTEVEETWVDLSYPDVSAAGWGNNDLPLVDDGSAFLRMTETDGWRRIYKVPMEGGKTTVLTPFNYDVASMRSATAKHVYYMASPANSTQRYLYSVDLRGKGNAKRVTPEEFGGLNNYNISPNGKYALHTHQSSAAVRTVRFVSLSDHKVLKTVVENADYAQKLKSLDLPTVRFEQVTTKEGLEIDARMVLPPNFDESQVYPVIFHVYGEPWGQVAVDTQVGMWDLMMAQKGYVVIDMDNRGTPCLKGSAWRKSIYRKIGVINTMDQAHAAKEILKKSYLDADRTAVWGWSGGGSMTLNLLFQYPDVYKTGVAVAAVSNQLVYDNIYQERYMGLPQENPEDFKLGSPINYAKNLKGNLLLIHGTGDDNVHYQSAEMLINELIKQDKQFDLMIYPNRSHGIYEGENTSKHLYTLLTNYILEKNPVNP